MTPWGNRPLYTLHMNLMQQQPYPTPTPTHTPAHMNKHALLYRHVHMLKRIFGAFSLLNNIPHASLYCMLKSVHTKVELRINQRCHVDSCSNVTLSDLFKWVYRHRGKSTKWKYLTVCFPAVLPTFRAWLYLYMCHVYSNPLLDIVTPQKLRMSSAIKAPVSGDHF